MARSPRLVFLSSTKRPTWAPSGQRAPGSQVRERPDAAALADRAVVDHRVGPDHAVGSDRGRAAQHHVRLQPAAGLEPHAAVDIGRGRIHDAHAGQHVIAQDARAQGGLALGQLGQRVDALARLGRRLVDRDGAAPVGREQADHVGQVELALRVVRREPRQRRGQGIAPEAVEPDVELVQRELVLARVARLDDARHALAVAHDAAVGVRRRKPCADERATDAVAAGRDRAAHRLGLDQRRVAREDDDELRRRGHRREADAHRVARPVGRRLHDDADSRAAPPRSPRPSRAPPRRRRRRHRRRARPGQPRPASAARTARAGLSAEASASGCPARRP